MRFSHAIRFGSFMKPQAFGTLTTGKETCAIGAALDAIGAAGDWLVRQGGIRHDWVEWWRQYWPNTRDLVVNGGCPVTGCYQQGTLRLSVGGAIVHLNDVHRWTRPQIADWVEAQEDKAGIIEHYPAQEANHEADVQPQLTDAREVCR